MLPLILYSFFTTVFSLSYEEVKYRNLRDLECKDGKFKQETLFQDYSVFEMIKPRIKKSDLPSVCEDDYSKGDEGRLYYVCQNNKWIKQQCTCPGMTYKIRGMDGVCDGIVKLGTSNSRRRKRSIRDDSGVDGAYKPVRTERKW